MTSAPAVAELVRRRAGRPWCLFVDRDGVINRRVVGDYVRDIDAFEFLPGAVEALVSLSCWAPHVVVVTNQQGVGKGLYSSADLSRVHRHLVEIVDAAGGHVDDVLFCPHLADARCACRKPRTGLARMWLSRHRDVRGDLSVMVGDSRSDIEMARRLGRHTGGCDAVHIRHDDQPAVVGPLLSYPSLAAFASEVEASLEGLSA